MLILAVKSKKRFSHVFWYFAHFMFEVMWLVSDEGRRFEDDTATFDAPTKFIRHFFGSIPIQSFIPVSFKNYMPLKMTPPPGC